MRDPLKEKLNDHIVIFDGGVGTEFYKRDFFVNASYEGLCLSNPDIVSEIHQKYVEAGAEVITANSFSANSNKLARHGLAEKTVEINQAAIKLAKDACDEDTIVAASIGPVGESSYNRVINKKRATEILGEQICALQDAGADFIMCETLATYRDVEYAYAAIEEYATIPFMFSFVVDRNLETQDGGPLTKSLALFEKGTKKPTAIGINCGMGAEGMLTALEQLLPITNYPVIVMPNAGLPKSVENRMIYMCSPEYLTTYAVRYINLGACGVGGCCGTGPEHIKDMARSIKPLAKTQIEHQLQAVEHTDEMQDPVPLAERSKFARKLANGEFVTTIEITPPRGFDLESTIEKSRKCHDAGIDAINIPDGPRASSRISPIITSIEIQQRANIEVILHCCCRDKNLIGMQADLLGCANKGVNNILFITGDPPKLGDYPFASAVFDVDSIGILKVCDKLNHGVDIGGKSIGSPTPIYPGAGADPNAIDMDREISRIREKVESGAEFLITQPVFATEPLLKMMDKIADLKVPVIAGIWPLASYRNAEFLKNEVPGVTVPDSIMKRMAAAETREEQRAVGIQIAREAVAELRDKVQGVQVSAPFGNVDSAIAVLKN
ncbi:MAG: bifunctional homocysteine S-methyltransferase/methylenetetrahydrofolate reductase [Lentisphaerae bacterium]|nr:bifunctional homocysteine S-methyltransferase/methylenetetrahydrofolate reductase [Lentisphaerota bacterium]MCP4100926.1 bifunctional homocysteine S-methyltransferase/methylenetetrahydrofolate reductase [Lentisphaerota bacterium]